MLLSTYIKQNKPDAVKKGMFSTVYLYENEAIIKTDDKIKECISLGWFPDSVHIPNISRTDLDDENLNVYVSERYTTSRSVKSILCGEDYELYKQLRNMCQKMTWTYKNHYEWQNDFTKAVRQYVKNEYHQELLIQCYEACMNFGYDVRFEISPRNVAANKDKRLILLDCFYIYSDLKR